MHPSPDDLPHTDPPQIETALWSGYAGRVAFDVGGHRGESVRFLEACGCTDIHIFEPEPDGAAEIARRYPWHTLNRFAISAGRGSLILRYSNGMLRDPDTDGLDWAPDGEQVTVPCTSLDTYRIAVGIVPDLIKVDVEGGEVGVVRGAAGIVAARHASWLIEFHSAENLDALRGLFAGYALEIVRHPLYAPESDRWRKHGWLRVFP